MKIRFFVVVALLFLSACKSEPKPPTDDAISMRLEVAVGLLSKAIEGCSDVGLSLPECESYQGTLSSRIVASNLINVAKTEFVKSMDYCESNRQQEFCVKLISEIKDVLIAKANSKI